MVIWSGLVHIMGKMHGFLKNCATDETSLLTSDCCGGCEWENILYLWPRTSQARFRWIFGPHGEKWFEKLGVWFLKRLSHKEQGWFQEQCCGDGVWRRQCGSLCWPHCCFGYAAFPSAHNAWVTRTCELFFLLATLYCCYPSRSSISNWMLVLLCARWIPCVHLLEAVWQQLRQDKLEK